MCQYLAGRPAFAGMTVDDIVSASDAWSLTLGQSNRVARNGAEVLARVGVTPFLRPRTAELSPFGPEAADPC